MQRSLQPELLDALPPTHPDALHNRRDLRLTNIAMRNYAWMCRKLPAIVRSGERALEIGAGTGELAAKLHARGMAVDGLDLWPRPAPWPPDREWHRTDLRTFDGWRRYPVIFGNLILHQFTDADLEALGERIRNARAIVFSEPLRRRISQVLYRAIAPLLGANYVTLHDAHVSIAAGFRGDELPRALGLDPRDWDITCATTHLGAYRMVAQRRS
jgi:hypothetical protein